MKIKNSAVPGITLAIQELANLRLPMGAAMKIRKLARRIEQQGEDVEAVRLQLIEQYTRRDGEGKKIIREDQTFDVEEGFHVAIRELLGLEFEVEPLTVAELAPAGNITPITLIRLGDLLVEGDEAS